MRSEPTSPPLTTAEMIEKLDDWIQRIYEAMGKLLDAPANSLAVESLKILGAITPEIRSAKSV